VKIISLESLQTWKKETNNLDTRIVRRDKQVEEMAQEIKENRDLKIEEG
jgi:hypothetical protein